MEELMTKLSGLAPNVVEQMIGWGLFCNWTGCIVGCLAFLGCVGLCYLTLKKDWDTEPLILFGLLGVLGVVILVASIMSLIRIYVWPYAYIVDKLT